jgi:protein disulfide-isomerase
MKKFLPLLLILFVLILQFRAALSLHLFHFPREKSFEEKTIGWHNQLDLAMTRAEKEKKPLFLYFEKKHSPWCAKMQKEILEDRGFVEEIWDFCIFVRLDRESCKNEAAFFRVKQVPLVILLDLQKERIAQMGYFPSSGKRYALEVKQLFSHVPSSQEAARKEGFEKSKLSLFSLSHFFPSLLNQYAELLQADEVESQILKEKRKEIEDLDPHNHLGLHRHLAFLEFHAFAQRSDPEKAIVPLLHYIELFGKQEKEDLWLLQMTIAQFLSQRGEEAKALVFARACYRMAPLAIKKEIALSISALKERMALSESFPRDDVE